MAYTMPRQQVSRADAKYHRLTKSDDDGGFIDLQFQRPPPKMPVKAILLATVLFIGGSFLIIMGSLLLAGVINTEYHDRTWPLLLLGALMFIPGAYHVRIAYYAWAGYHGYSYEDIPEFD